MTWTFYNAQGQEKRATSVVPAEYVILGGGGAAASAPQNTWTRLALGAVTQQSSAAATCLRFNADGTLTVLQTGWYSLTALIGPTGAMAAAQGTQISWWTDTTDTTPAPPVTTPMRCEYAMTAGFPIWVVTGDLYIVTGTRIGTAAYNRDATARTYATTQWTVARIGGGPQGIQGPPGSGTAGPPILTSLPISPTNGDEILLQTASMLTDGIGWHLRYESALSGSSKWLFVGGRPLYAENDASFTTSAVGGSPAGHGSFQATTGLSVTVPAPGVYDVDVLARLQPPATAGQGAVITVAGGSAVADGGADAQGALYYPGVSSAASASVSMTSRFAFSLAQTVAWLSLRSSTNATAASCTSRRLRMTPVRLG